MNKTSFLRFLEVLTTTNADDVDVHDANKFALRLIADLNAALARAEAAEADLVQARAFLDVWESAANDDSTLVSDLLARINFGEAERAGLCRRVAELEAALDAERAAHQWRPVTEDWPHYHDRVVIAHWGGTWAQFARRVQSDDGEDEWLLDDGRKFDFESASVVALLTSPPPLPH